MVYALYSCFAQLEDQRRYLGGDSEHTVLVKGLDFALLEQNKARAAAVTEDDDTLEQAFIEGSSTIPAKRTREEIVADLKNKRAKGDAAEGPPAATDASLEQAKKAGKFKPIGFKPIGGSEAKGKKKVVKKVKKKKVEVQANAGAATKEGEGERMSETVETKGTENATATSNKPPEPEPEPMDEDFDIFAGADEYTGLDLGDDEDGEVSDEPGAIEEEAGVKVVAEPPLKRRWIEDDSDSAPTRPDDKPDDKAESSVAQHRPTSAEIRDEPEEGEEQEEEAPVRLAPLASSSVPSIRELLAMDQEEEKREKRKAKKEKKKGPLTSAAKVDRDYQRYVHIHIANHTLLKFVNIS